MTLMFTGRKGCCGLIPLLETPGHLHRTAATTYCRVANVANQNLSALITNYHPGRTCEAICLRARLDGARVADYSALLEQLMCVYHMGHSTPAP